jgi:hypothetical protein
MPQTAKQVNGATKVERNEQKSIYDVNFVAHLCENAMDLSTFPSESRQ